MILTGGTTGIPKAVVLSNENLNAMSVQYEMSGIPHGINENKFLNIMPPFLAYGLVDGIHMPLSLGMENILVTKFEPNELPNLILKYKPNHFMGVPDHLDKIRTSKFLKNKNLSYLLTVGVGGDSLSSQRELLINEFLEQHGVVNKIQKGFGMTEGASALLSTLSNECNKIGSVGIPLLFNVVSIFKPGTDEELKYGEEGEICIKTPTRMLKYLNNDEEYNKVVKSHSDGSIWIHSEDLGYMDEDGFLFHKGRIKRMIIRPDGHNVFPLAIENAILLNEKVSECAVIGVDSEFDKQGQYPKAFVVLNDKYKNESSNIVDELDKICQENFPERDVPYYYEFVDTIPKTLAGKVDFKQLEQLGIENCYKSIKYKTDFGAREKQYTLSKKK